MTYNLDEVAKGLKCSHVLLHNFISIENGAKCLWCKKTVKEVMNESKKAI